MGAIVSPAYTKAAKGQQCTLNIAGVCSYNRETVVFCHFPNESGGMAEKSDDICGGDGCYACHQVIDNPGSNEHFEQHRAWYLMRSMVRTIRRRIEQGVVTIK